MSDEWMDLKAEAMTHEQAIEAVKALRGKVLSTTESKSAEENMAQTGLWTDEEIKEAIKGAKDKVKLIYEKPPLGCKPAYISSPERIVELSKAITRQAEDMCNEQLIRRWATEILYHCEILEKC